MAQTPAPTGNYNFTFTGNNGTVAKGVLNVMNGLITGVTGTSNSLRGGGPLTITGIVAPGGFTRFNGNDNLLFTSNPQLTASQKGFAFSTSDGLSQDIFSNGGGYSLFDTVSGSDFGTFQATAAPVPAPSPGAGLISWLIAALAAAGLYGWNQLRKPSGGLVATT